jgi:membrane-bound lytic murein transglycosylase D
LIRFTFIRLSLPALALLAAACGRSGPLPVAVAPSSPPALPVTAFEAPVVAVDRPAELVAQSAAWFAAGEQRLSQGHLDEARRAFDRAVDVLLACDAASCVDPRVRRQLAELVDRVTALETAAMASGDGFTERAYEPASIDELLSEETALELPSRALEAAVYADLTSSDHDIDIPLNDRVLSYVNLFRDRRREWFVTTLQRGTRYLPMIQSVFKAEGLPLDLAFVPMIESAFKATAVSRAKAKGFWQFMRATGREQGLRQDWFVDERADPEKATLAAARYLKELVGLFDGDWHLALASYNGGPARVQRALKRSGRRTFWDLARSDRILPRETREYVPMILAVMILARNPGQYGLEITPEPRLAYDTVVVDRPVDLRKVAEWSGASIDEIRELNPELRRLITPAKAEQYELRVPAGAAERVDARLAQAPTTELASVKWHQVRRGETLSGVARRYGVRRLELAEANNLQTSARLQPGQELLIPYSATTTVASGPSRGGREAWLAATRSAGNGRLIYRVRRGDTLGAIARAFDTTVSAIQAWNRLTSTRLMPGDELMIHTTRSAEQ